MRVHHLNCTSMCPPGGRFIDGKTPFYRPATLVSHCLLVEAPEALILVDTGLGLDDVRSPATRLSPLFRAVNRPRLREPLTAVRQIEALGYSPRDVRHIVLTHLEPGHRFRMTMTFDALDPAGTRLTWRMAFDSAAEVERVGAMVAACNEQNFDRLQAELARAAEGSSR